jgi:hypothetical protein
MGILQLAAGVTHIDPVVIQQEYGAFDVLFRVRQHQRKALAAARENIVGTRSVTKTIVHTGIAFIDLLPETLPGGQEDEGDEEDLLHRWFI